MRVVVVLLSVGVVFSGCATAERNGKGAKTARTAQTTSEIKPVDILSGRVVRVNDALRFVVVDFGVGRLPQLEQRLDVYREGQKVGEVRISNQARAGNVAADVMLGEARVGDEVRGK